MAPPTSTTDPVGRASHSSSGSGNGVADKALAPSDAKQELAAVYAADKGLPTSGDEEPRDDDLWRIWRKYPEESWGSYGKRLFTEGDSVPDAFLTVAASQIGQIMLTCPNALWKAGLIPGSIFMGLAIVFSLTTMFFMNVLYVEYKRAKIKDGSWFRKDRHVTQYHDVLSHHAGKIIGYTAQTFVIMQLLGTGVAQVVACATDWYAVDKRRSKRELQVIWGAVLQVFTFFPTFRHFRILNIAALAGTTMTAIWLLHESAVDGYDYSAARLWPRESANGVTSAPQYFFNGAAVLMNAVGGHAISIEMMDAMKTPRQYTSAYVGGWLWTMFLVVPHSISINLAFGPAVGANDNVYAIVPDSKAKKASVGLMVIHQLAAFAYYLGPVYFLWERFIGTHTKPWYIRLPSRLPVSLFVWLFAMLFPFYGAINSLMSSIAVPFTAFALPCLVYVIVYYKEERRAVSPLPPYRFLQVKGWLPVFVICGAAVIIYCGFGFAAIAYSIKSIVDNSKAFGVFARCYQCPKGWENLLTNPGNNL